MESQNTSRDTGDLKEPIILSIEEFLRTLPEKEYKAYEIAKSHLGTTFDLKKSNGYLEWVKKQSK